MNNREAYNTWSKNYDIVLNRTRDLEAVAIRKIIPGKRFAEILEIGCGTGKNTGWLANKTDHLTAVDFSEEMLNKAREKTNLKNVEFKKADITREWNFNSTKADLITCSLILEHINDIHFVFRQANNTLKAGGLFYLGELHPFKQYSGTKARFETANGVFELECFIHHISDYFECAIQNNFNCLQLQEWFDDEDKTTVPRLINFLFEKK